MKKELLISILLFLLFIPFISAQSLEELSKINLEQKITIPENFQNITYLLFGVKHEIQISNIIILLSIWLVILLLIFKTLNSMENQLFNNPLISFIISLIITSLGSIYGGVGIISKVYYETFSSILNIFVVFQKYPIFNLAICAIIPILGLTFVLKIMKKVKNEGEIERYRKRGREIGFREIENREKAKIEGE